MLHGIDAWRMLAQIAWRERPYSAQQIAARCMMYDQAQELDMAAAPQNDNSLDLEQTYLVRTILHTYIGRLKSVSMSDLVLSDAVAIEEHMVFGALETGSVPSCRGVGGDTVISRYAVEIMKPWAYAIPASPRVERTAEVSNTDDTDRDDRDE